MVTATGVVLDIDRSTNLKIEKKLKLMGVPYKIFKNMAFIKYMCSSALNLEVAELEGTNVRLSIVRNCLWDFRSN